MVYLLTDIKVIIQKNCTKKNVEIGLECMQKYAEMLKIFIIFWYKIISVRVFFLHILDLFLEFFCMNFLKKKVSLSKKTLSSLR